MSIKKNIILIFLTLTIFLIDRISKNYILGIAETDGNVEILFVHHKASEIELVKL